MAAWKRTPVGDDQWRPLPHATKQFLSDEQDTAAGGRDQRAIIGTESALGRVILQVKYHRVYAELRWQVCGRRYSRYLGEVTAPSRAQNLVAAWQLAKQQGLTS